ncbi:MAG: transporter substrate-binding domain-containing protein [Clostridia bacterium]|nr:transporter substrate-binding domain-containing protein [Clostridia bacterium]
MKKFSVVIAAILLVCMVFSVACQKEDEGSKNNFGKELLTYSSQLDALNGLKKGDADIAVIDSVMAGYYMNDTDSFKDYQVLENVVLAEEKYGIAAKKGNDALMSKINEAIIGLVDTDYKTIAATYGLTTELLVKADTKNPLEAASDESWNKVVAAKKIVVGYTLFAPIAYNEGDGENAVLKGFDIDLAKAVVNYLNTKYEAEIAVEFMIIDWNSKEALLENGTIDLVWNGMTITPEREAGMSISVPYLANKQVAVIAKANSEKYKSANYDEFVKATKDAVVVVEKGSAGEGVVVPSEE